MAMKTQQKSWLTALLGALLMMALSIAGAAEPNTSSTNAASSIAEADEEKYRHPQSARAKVSFTTLSTKLKRTGLRNLLPWLLVAACRGNSPGLAKVSTKQHRRKGERWLRQHHLTREGDSRRKMDGHYWGVREESVQSGLSRNRIPLPG
ncbi:MAG: hypothetical protein CMK32_08335 [Porticoccaceae bacterium]|nr:hypothetical protein [Porticoccaceae bacterium]